MERLPQGHEYHFVNVPYDKVTRTFDVYFPTDDERFEERNYFLSYEATVAAYEGVVRNFYPMLKKADEENKSAKTKDQKAAAIARRRNILRKIKDYIASQPKTL